ncbi:MAG TPA: single-stranded DNA-binding protein [Streptosporangiaceae bacterium]|nr:single-stranded DNA-binding protein [Streptosporangiaceae bacterium]
MFNEAHVSLTGYVATQPVIKEIGTGITNLTMRVAWTPRWQDRVTGEWVDGNTSYVTVICWRKLAGNVATCMRKGDPVVVKGRLSVRNFDGKEGVPRTAVEIDASSVGHDLSRGVATFHRVRPQIGMTANEYASSVQSDGQPAMNGAASMLGAAHAGQAGDPGPGDDLFDEAAISELAADEEPAAVPF